MPRLLPPYGLIDYYYASMSSGSNYRRALVASQFHRARRRAAIESLLSRFSGEPVDLLSFDEVVGKLGVSGQSSLGVQQIPVAAIVGSVGRYQDFSRTFLPRRMSDEDRWVSVGAAATTVADLPPIEVYKVGDSYFVLDGNHRVSLARMQGLDFIDAAIVEVRTRAPLPPGAKPDGLIIAAEHAAFLTYTGLDSLRPHADVQVSVPGQYCHLENHIEAYRFILEVDNDVDISFPEAVGRWYDEAYLPMVEAIREQGILRYFPGRTETDFFVWLARHRADLQNELGYKISPDVAVSRLLSKVKDERSGVRPPLAARLRRLTRLTPPEQAGARPLRTWAEERTLGRYSDHLFANVLYPIAMGGNGHHEPQARVGLVSALTLSETEGAQFCALCVTPHTDLTPAESAAIDTLRRFLEQRGQPAALLTETGDAIQWTLELAFLNDLVVLDRDFNPRTAESAPTAAVRAIIEAARRPLLITGREASDRPLRRGLLVHDTRRRFDEALFIGAYLAEQWKTELSVLPLSNGRNTEEVVDRISDYLALHEVDAVFHEAARPAGGAIEQIIDAAQSGECDLIILSGPERGRSNSQNNQSMDVIWAILQRWPHSILIAT